MPPVSAAQLSSTMNLYDGDNFRTVALHNAPSEAFAVSRMNRVIHPHPKSALGDLARSKQIIQISDLRTQLPYLEGDPAVVELSDVAGARTLVVVPMLKESELIGTITIYRQEGQTRFTGKSKPISSQTSPSRPSSPSKIRLDLLNELREQNHGIVAVAGRTADRSGPLGANREARVARSANGGPCARDQETA